MKLNNDWHWVDFHGMQVPKPKDLPFLASEEDGCLYGFGVEPKPGNVIWHPLSDRNRYLFYVDLEGMDWRKSLVKYDQDGNIVKPKRKFMIRGEVVERPSDDHLYVLVGLGRQPEWHRIDRHAYKKFDDHGWESMIYIGDLQEVFDDG